MQCKEIPTKMQMQERQTKLKMQTQEIKHFHVLSLAFVLAFQTSETW